MIRGKKIEVIFTTYQSTSSSSVFYRRISKFLKEYLSIGFSSENTALVILLLGLPSSCNHFFLLNDFRRINFSTLNVKLNLKHQFSYMTCTLSIVPSTIPFTVLFDVFMHQPFNPSSKHFS